MPLTFSLFKSFSHIEVSYRFDHAQNSLKASFCLQDKDQTPTHFFEHWHDLTPTLFLPSLTLPHYPPAVCSSRSPWHFRKVPCTLPNCRFRGKRGTSHLDWFLSVFTTDLFLLPQKKKTMFFFAISLPHWRFSTLFQWNSWTFNLVLTS